MTKTEKREVFISFDSTDRAQVHDHEFSRSGAIALTDDQGNYTSIAFDVSHIGAIEGLLNVLYAHRGDFDDVMSSPPALERMAA